MTTTTESHRHSRSCYWDLTRARWSCSGFVSVVADVGSVGSVGQVGTTDGPERDRALVDVRDMLVVHAAMLRELRLAPAAVRRVPAGDVRRARVVAGHVQFLTDLLHHHHQGEDDLLWPVLRARTPPRAAAVIDEVESQHAGLDTALAEVERLRASWADAPSAPARDALADHLEQLHVLLRDHLDLEERELLPLAAAVLTEAEWHAIGEAGVAGMRRSTLPLAFGMFAYEGDPAVLADMLGAAPRLARVVLPALATRAYARRARRVHGTDRP